MKPCKHLDHTEGKYEDCTHIVRCVNAHDGLVAVCQRIVDGVDDGDEMTTVDMARAAIARATGAA